jgi:uncharacterized protein YfaS (alpha-2-macroglobulin family)
MPYASTSIAKTITVQTVSVSLSVDNTRPKAGDTITFTGRVTSNGTPLANRSVNLYLIHPTGSPYWIIASGTTDSNGNFTARWTVPYRVTRDTATYTVPCTTWIFRLCDAWTGVCSSDLRIPAAYSTALSITTDKDAYAPGETINVSARLVYATDTGTFPLPGATITFVMRDTSTGDIVATQSATTGSDGVARVSFRAPTKTGSYQIRAEFGGMGYALPTAVSRALSVLSSDKLKAVLAAAALGAIMLKMVM